MEIKVHARLKTGHGAWMVPGLYNDNEEPFARNIYEEILKKRKTITLLSGTLKEAKRKADGGFIAGEDFEVPKDEPEKVKSPAASTTMVDPGSKLDTTIDEPEEAKPSSSRRRRKT